MLRSKNGNKRRDVHGRPAGLRRAILVALLTGATVLSGCSRAAEPNETGAVKVAASTPIIANLVQNVAGDRTEVTSLVPFGADPHTYEPSLAALKNVARADVVFSNGLLLEDQALTTTINANLPQGTSNIELGEKSVAYGARHIALVEDASLATVWLGFRVEDDATQDADQRDPNATVTMEATAEGPGTLSAFTTGTFGQPTAWIVSGRSAEENQVDLPLNAHTHMSWGFSQAGIYTVNISAYLNRPGAERENLGSSTITFAVGIDPTETGKTRQVNSGHVDITAHTSGEINLRGEVDSEQTAEWEAAESVVVVPHSTATTVPADPSWDFLGHPGSQTWVLAQAVVGRHVHGDVDPHMWLDVANAVAYVEVIRDELTRVDPAGGDEYAANAQAYIDELRRLDAWARQVTASIPERNRKLVTTHDGFGYLADAYGLQVAGFVAPNPTAEPSAQALANLTRTLIDLGVPAVFSEPGSNAHHGELAAAAASANSRVCELVSDTLTDSAPNYVQMVKNNIGTLKDCLDPSALPAWDPDFALANLPSGERAPIQPSDLAAGGDEHAGHSHSHSHSHAHSHEGEEGAVVHQHESNADHESDHDADHAGEAEHNH